MVVEWLTVRETFEPIQKNIRKIIIKSYSKLIVNSLMTKKKKIPKEIINITDIKMLYFFV